MTDREKLIELLSEDFVEYCHVDIIAGHCKIRAITFDVDRFADHLLANGVTFRTWIPVTERLPEDEYAVTPAVPGPEIADPNIMELCFRNGEKHMRDKIKTSLLELSSDMPCVTISQVIKILEDLQ